MTTYNNAAVAAVCVKALAVRSSNAAYTSKEHGNDGEKADHFGRWWGQCNGIRLRDYVMIDVMVLMNESLCRFARENTIFIPR
jgi:hypothetical protein